jgi:predicted GIY-YIG superfamily endonuclease
MATWKTIYSNDYPEVEGCYAVFLTIRNSTTYLFNIKKCKLVYIGTTNNLKHRMATHKMMKHNPKSKCLKIIKYKQILSNDRKELEIKLIKRLNPFLNKAHNG